MSNWSWKPDPTTVKRLRDGNRKLRKPELSSKRIEEMKMEVQTESTAPKAKAVRKSVKKVSKVKKVAKVAKSSAPKDANLIPLKTLCKTLNVDPRLARRKLRKAGLSGHDARDRWTFKKDSTALAKAREVLVA